MKTFLNLVVKFMVMNTHLFWAQEKANVFITFEPNQIVDSNDYLFFLYSF